MKRRFIRTLAVALASAGLTTALLGLPAQGKDDDERRPEASLRLHLPERLPADRAELRREAEDAIECVRKRAADLPGFESDEHGVLLRSHAPEELREIAEDCGLPVPPPPPEGFPLDRQDREAFRERLGKCLEAHRERRGGGEG
jgi:hypothetical protein